MSLALREFLLASYDKPFQWGERDCALWVAEWIQAVRGVDPGLPFRGTYGSEYGCALLLARHGGLLKLARRAFGAAGLHEIDNPDAAAAGDVACVEAPFGPTLGIVTGWRVALLGREGLVISAAWPRLAAWTL